MSLTMQRLAGFNRQQGSVMNTTRIVPTIAAVLIAVALLYVPLLANNGEDRNERRRLHVTKECSHYTYEAGSSCTITSSSLGRIRVGSTVTYDQAFGIPTGMLDSNVVLDAGNGDRAVGRCTFDGATGLGLCTFSDGLGRFAGFKARVEVSYLGGFDWAWDGWYSFDQ